MKTINEELLDEDPESLVLEADDNVQYDPKTKSNIVVLEPEIITQGRRKRKSAVRDMQSQ